jgi:translation initiation factor IF-1
MPDATIHAVGLVEEPLNPVLYRVSLPNGKRILAHLSKPLMQAAAHFRPNDRVILELTPFDFDQARILGLAG